MADAAEGASGKTADAAAARTAKREQRQRLWRDRRCKLRSGIAASWKLCTDNWKFFTGVGFLVTVGIQIYSLQETIAVTQQTAQVTLARSLQSEFSDTADFRAIERSIVAREKLYRGAKGDRGGKYSWSQINAYLGFFEQLGLYEKIGTFDYELIDFLFGGAIIEAYLDDDVRDYVSQIRSEGGQKTAFEEFERLARRLVAEPHRASHVKTYSNGFTQW